jgi:hypothetical protein
MRYIVPAGSGLLIFAMTSLPVFAQKAAVNPPTRANVLAQHQPAAWFSHHTSPKGCGSMARRMHLRRCCR